MQNTETTHKDAAMNLSRGIFWDTNYDTIDWDKKVRFVIERVVMYGTLSDWKAICSKYGLDRIRDELLQARDLDRKTLSFLSCIFNIPKEEFRCYNTIRSNPGHWVY